jgi:hypothetical protein
VRRLERAEPDALVAAADLGVEGVVRARVDVAVDGARAATGRHLVGGEVVRARESEEGGGGARWAARSEVGGGGASDTRGGEELSVAVGFALGWRLIGRVAAGATTLSRGMAKSARQKISGPRHFRAPAGGARGLSRAVNRQLICRAQVLARLLDML